MLLLLLGRLGHLAAAFLLVDRLDDTDCYSLPHIAHGESPKRRVIGEGLHAHGLHGLHEDDGGITRLDELGLCFELLSRTTVNLCLNRRELAGNVAGVAIKNWGITVPNLARVVEDDNLRGEISCLLCRVVLGIGVPK